jgi:CRISPR/Cas system-associated endonuclease/helicase Cas3
MTLAMREQDVVIHFGTGEGKSDVILALAFESLDVRTEIMFYVAPYTMLVENMAARANELGRRRGLACALLRSSAADRVRAQVRRPWTNLRGRTTAR